MTIETPKTAELLADSSRGIYIPQYFAELADHSEFPDIEESDWVFLKAGPSHGLYWDVWDDVLMNKAETPCGGILHQDGDLWLIWPEQAIQAVNDACESALEYETRHHDAGENYAHMPAESWTDQKTRDFIQEMLREKFESSEYVQGSGWVNYKPQWQVLGIDPRWKAIDRDALADLALESFSMVAGSVFGCYDDGITLDGYARQEIEVDLDSLGIDDLTLAVVRESCEAYISGCGRAYVTTDACWYALLDIESFNNAIASHCKG